MNQSRRKFLAGSATILGAGLLGSHLLSANVIKSKHLVGLQLYSVRAEMTKDPLATLNQLAEMGYKNVEHANYIKGKFYGFAPKEFRKILDDLGLAMPSGHTVMGKPHWDENKKEFTDLWKQTIEDAAILGQKFVISPWLDASYRKDKDGLLRMMEVFNKSGELCRQSGMQFGYHNHDFEFSESLDGEQLYDIMLNNTDPKLVMQQLDIGNMVNGGGKAEEVLKKFPNRFQSMHVKDEIPSNGGNEKFESCVLGKGTLDVKGIVELGLKKGGTTDLIIEQEAYQGQAPIDAMKEDLEVMTKWGF